MAQKKKRQQVNGVEQNIAPAPAQIVGAFKIKPAAQYLGGLSVITMHRLIERGLLHPNRALRHILFSKAELDRFLAEHTTEGS
jgi:hypothetical protein